MRILRIFKLVRHFAGLQSLIFTLQQAYQASQKEEFQQKKGGDKWTHLLWGPWAFRFPPFFNFQAVTRTVLFIYDALPCFSLISRSLSRA